MPVDTCPLCGGEGVFPAEGDECPKCCGGKQVYIPPNYVPCILCKGRGSMDGARECPTCHGLGSIPPPAQVKKCHACGGTGESDDPTKPCKVCTGTGYL